jgi:hypothetical protein
MIQKACILSITKFNQCNQIKSLTTLFSYFSSSSSSLSSSSLSSSSSALSSSSSSSSIKKKDWRVKNNNNKYNKNKELIYKNNKLKNNIIDNRKVVVIEKGKLRLFQDGNPLIYSGAIKEVYGRPTIGDEVEVEDHNGNIFARGFFNQISQYKVLFIYI